MTYLHHLNKNLHAIREIVEKIYDNFPENIESIIRNVTAQMTNTNANYDETQINKIYSFILSLKTFQGIDDPWQKFLELNDSKILNIDLGFQAGLGFLGCHTKYGIEYPIDNYQLFLIQMTNLYAIQQYVEIILSGQFDSTKIKCDELYKDIYNHMLAFWICIKNKEKSKEKVIGQYLRVVIMKNHENPIDLQNCGIDQNIINTLNNAITKDTQMKEYKTFGENTLKNTPSLSHLYFPFQNLLNNIQILKETLNIKSFETIPKYLLYIRLFKKPNTEIYEWKVTDTTLFKNHLKHFLTKDDTDLQMFKLPSGNLPSYFSKYRNTLIETAINDLFKPITQRSIINGEENYDINTEKKRGKINTNRTQNGQKYPVIPPFEFQDLNSLKSDPSALVEQLFHREIDVSEICGITGNEIVYVKDEKYGY